LLDLHLQRAKLAAPRPRPCSTASQRRLLLLWPLLLLLLLFLLLRKKRAHLLACLARRVYARVAVGDEALPVLDYPVERPLRVVAAFLEGPRAELPRAAGRVDELLHSKLPRAARRGDDLHRFWAAVPLGLGARSISLLLDGPSRVAVDGWWRLARKAQLPAGVEARWTWLSPRMLNDALMGASVGGG